MGEKNREVETIPINYSYKLFFEVLEYRKKNIEN